MFTETLCLANPNRLAASTSCSSDTARVGLLNRWNASLLPLFAKKEKKKKKKKKKGKENKQYSKIAFSGKRFSASGKSGHIKTSAFIVDRWKFETRRSELVMVPEPRGRPVNLTLPLGPYWKVKYLITGGKMRKNELKPDIDDLLSSWL